MWTADEIAFATFIVTCFYTFFTLVYVILVAFTLGYIHKQLEQQKKEHKLQETLTIFKELQAKEIRESRSYIYERMPQQIESLADDDFQKHLVGAEEAMLAFDRIGYSLSESHLDPEPIISNYWPIIWKCWKRTEKFIQWARDKRNSKTYLKYFENLFYAAEEYRIRNRYEEPKLYTVSRIIR